MSLLNLPVQTLDRNVKSLAQVHRERQTGLTTTAITLEERAVEGTELVFKNRLLLDPSGDYTIEGNAITLTVAAVAGDVFVCWYWFR